MKQAIKFLFTPWMLLAVTATMLLMVNVQADTGTDIEKVRTEITKMIPQADQAEIVATPVKGVYRLQIQGTYAYVFVDGDYVLLGDLYNTKEQVNLGEKASAERMAGIIETVPTEKMIVFGPKDAKRHITVFTDIDCGFCRKLHREVPELVEAGVQVRYLAFPRAGIGSKSHKKYVSVWCNDDRQKSLTAAKSGEEVLAASCDNPIEETHKLGREVGVTGTPTIIFDTGEVTPGYVPYKTLLQKMGIGTENGDSASLSE